MTRGLGYLILLAGGLIFILFVLKYKVYALESDLRNVDHQIKSLADSVRVLKAEFNYLNRPHRIRLLASKLTSLKPLSENHLFLESELVFHNAEPEVAS